MAAKHSEGSFPEQQGPAAKLRFVVLEHDSPRGQHWDLMLEQEGKLRTWALAAPPDTQTLIPAESLPDHRLEYLDYEGPISGGRGEVRRWDAGAYQPLPTADPHQPEEIYLLEGGRLRGCARLLPPTTPSSQWQFRFEPS